MSSSPSSLHQENAVRLLEILNSTTDTNVEINDEATHGLFGDLYSGQEFLEALIEAATASTNEQQQHQDNVGMPVAVVATTTSTMLPRSQDHSWTTFLSRQLEIITPRELPLEIHNLSNVPLRVRWINQQGGCSIQHDHDDHDDHPSHSWDIPPQSTWEQYCQPGHLFVLSLVVHAADGDDSNSTGEQVVGAYRPKRPLPSLTAHALLVQEIDMSSSSSSSSTSASVLLLETMLLDSTRFDALTVAAADLDYPSLGFRPTRQSEHPQRETLSQIQLLQTIVQNVVLHHAHDEKYHKLKVSNSKLRRYIVDSWGAMEMLNILGFVEKTMPAVTASSSSSCSEIASRKAATTDNAGVDDGKGNNQATEPCLVMVTPTPPASLDIGRHALTLLDILQARVSSQFVAELAPPTPWQAPAAAAGGSRPGEAWTASAERGRFVITDEERWARAERVAALRRSGAGRRPSPGNAPSSRGKWGR